MGVFGEGESEVGFILSTGSISVLLKSPGYHFDVPVGENYLHLLSVQIIVYPP